MGFDPDLHYLDIIGVGFGPNIDWCRERLPIGRWLDADLRPSFNPLHVREWTQGEVLVFMEIFLVAIERFELTRTDNRWGGLTTQLVVMARPEERR
ncbi:hypothetical protein [Frankia sp. Cppng1_Ct_nod]|uniref:hypothetical protein n=1 Tax=Frankia sp. Cppng1_Ct_nod TaxID=2897162 RepID=UPI0010414403|nr:hypothetical protein [Frankia sp. Cppng1_Ct_nod]